MTTTEKKTVKKRRRRTSRAKVMTQEEIGKKRSKKLRNAKWLVKFTGRVKPEYTINPEKVSWFRVYIDMDSREKGNHGIIEYGSVKGKERTKLRKKHFEMVLLYIRYHIRGMYYRGEIASYFDEAIITDYKHRFKQHITKLPRRS